MSVMPRPAAVEAAIPIPALAPVLRALGGECVVVVDEGRMDVGRVGVVVKGVDVDVDVDVDADTDADTEGVEDGVMLLLMDEVAEDGVVGLSSACAVRDSGEGAKKVSLPGSI